MRRTLDQNAEHTVDERTAPDASKRRFARTPLRTPIAASLRWLDSETREGVDLVDLSESGCAVMRAANHASRFRTSGRAVLFARLGCHTSTVVAEVRAPRGPVLGLHFVEASEASLADFVARVAAFMEVLRRPHGGRGAGSYWSF